MFEFMKVINESRYMNKAFEKLWEQFPDLKGVDPSPFNGPWEIRCFQEATKPYVMVKHVIVNNTMVRAEWYEYYKMNGIMQDTGQERIVCRIIGGRNGNEIKTLLEISRNLRDGCQNLNTDILRFQMRTLPG